MAPFNSYADVKAALDAESANWNNVQGHTDEAVRAHALAARDCWHNYQHPAPAPAPYVPPPPPPGQDQVNYTPVKIPEANVVAFLQEQVGADALEKLYFEDVGGTEILSVARHDTIGGEPVATAPIANIEDILSSFNPLNILTSTNMDELFNQFAIDMSTHVKNLYTAIGIERDAEVRIDEEGNEREVSVNYLYIQLDNLAADEYVQIQVAPDDMGDTIYDESWYNGSGGTP